MSRVYQLVLIISLSFFSIANAKSSDFIGVSQYLNQYNSEIKNQDYYHLSAVSQRCAGVFGAYAKYLPTDMKDMKTRFINLSIMTIEKSINFLNMKKDNKPDLNAKQVDKAVRYFVDVYYKNLEIDQQNTGTIMKGNSSIDMNLCMGLFKK